MADHHDRGYSPSYVNSLTIIICVLLSVLTSVAVCYLMASHRLPMPGQVANTPAVDEALTANVKQVLANNPNLIIEALTKNQQAPALAATGAPAPVAEAAPAQPDPAVPASVISQADELFKHAGSPVLGNAKGDVTLVEFFDFNCGYCRRVAPEVDNVIKADKKLRLVHKNLPILGDDSIEAAKIALAAGLQGAGNYEKIYNAFIGAADHLTAATMEAIVRQQGLDWKKIQADKDSQAVKDEINANYKLAQSLGLNGTPAFVVGDKMMPGAQDASALQTAIATARRAPAK